ncbi:restriction endonuclease [Sinomonas albida]|uniref:restriction endonuclease n=1 Tax=Sinomonas albida TaxID=369942 RepID=UPI003016AAEB
MTVKQVGPAIIKPLIDALSSVYWYKKDLREFLLSALPNNPEVRSLDPNLSKRDMVSGLIHTLHRKQNTYFDDLVRLILAVDDINDPGWLKQLTDGPERYAAAKAALRTLQTHVAPYRELRSEADQISDRQEQAKVREERRRAHIDALGELQQEFRLVTQLDPQNRGYELEKLLAATFRFFEIDARGSFRILGEQIDGAFTFEGTEFLLESKWQSQMIGLADVNAFIGKVDGKLDNTLGLFVAINGFQPTAIERLNGAGRSRVILMDGSDLAAVFEDRISLPMLLARKKQHAAQTGEVMLTAWSIS